MGKDITLTSRTASSSAPMGPSRKASRAARSSSSKRFSASIITSARSPTATRSSAISPLRRRCSIAARRISSPAMTAPRWTRRAACRQESRSTIASPTPRPPSTREVGRQGRRARLLHGRLDRLPLDHPPQRRVGRRRLLRRPDRAVPHREAEGAGDAAFRREGSEHPLDRRREDQGGAARRADLSSIWAPATASIATSAARSMPKRRKSRPAARRSSSRSTSAKRRPSPASLRFGTLSR